MQASPTDNQLVQQAKNGQTEAFSVLVERYRQKVFQTCMGFLHNVDDAEDLTQEIFIKAWDALKSFDGKSAFPTWLYRIAITRSINQVRKNKLRAFAGLNDEVTQSKDTEETAEENLTRREQKKQIKQAINNLKTKQKKAFILFYYQELSINEVADVLKMTPKAAESLVFRARKNLQNHLSR